MVLAEEKNAHVRAMPTPGASRMQRPVRSKCSAEPPSSERQAWGEGGGASRRRGVEARFSRRRGVEASGRPRSSAPRRSAGAAAAPTRRETAEWPPAQECPVRCAAVGGQARGPDPSAQASAGEEEGEEEEEKEEQTEEDLLGPHHRPSWHRVTLACN
ncbi:unnamed protein product [Prorocentrum cordatum]|uniref:Uncharacterized protein n=1 Tax=Prorocentrum cordatum TaxID=2364126 RepID=A0ABN9SL17_9DINO|nr:unnamed protein product [Polarella glacialis]